MMELLNVESVKSDTKITADEACRGVSQYTLRYRYVTGSGLRPDTPKSVALYATLFPRIDLLRRFVSDCFFCFFFIYLSHLG
ncbi:TPA: hypothetical protein I4G21_24655 [Enterobacter hormaechei subsp. hoffmannii]|nr:hypothetical protein [Escherichia coli]PQA53813.1 hypothetical protein C5F31_26270 [Escherichia coli]HAS1748153.1 hypothetical protein [Enterobacter hormaechei subsp. hoffmannii]